MAIYTPDLGKMISDIRRAVRKLEVQGLKLPQAMAAGVTTISGTAIAQYGAATVNVTFPTNRFSTPPIVTFSIAGFVTGSAVIVAVQADTITTSGCRLVVRNYGAPAVTIANLPLQWIAVQMAKDSAAG